MIFKISDMSLIDYRCLHLTRRYTIIDDENTKYPLHEIPFPMLPLICAPHVYYISSVGCSYKP